MLRRTIASTVVLTAAATGASFANVIASSTFDNGTDGWTLVVSTVFVRNGGNPGGFLFGSVAEPTNTTAIASAPSTFLGDWSGLDGSGEIRFDYRRITNGGGAILEFIPLTVSIKGGTVNPNGVATWSGQTITQPSPWETFEVPIDARSWVVSAGSWSDIMSHVTELTIQIELVSNTDSPDDTNGIDNVVLDSGASSVVGDLDGDGLVNATDLGILLGAWGSPDEVADLDGNGVVGAADLGILLGAWTG